MIFGSLLLLGLFVFPLWNIQLGAPQYPDPLGMNIYINGIEGQSEFDIQNIDGLNHYIGMKTLPKPGDMWEFKYFPIIVMAMVILGLVLGILGFTGKFGPGWFLSWSVLMTILGALGIYDFNQWMIDYGTNLDPNAILKLQNPDGTPMSYKPPLLGHKKLLNFDAYSYPSIGGYMTGMGLLLTYAAYLIGRRRRVVPGAGLVLIIGLSINSCSVEPEPIDYGHDQCHYCRMTIVDQIHAAQLVNDKGKVFKYDAVECMINDARGFEHGQIALMLVNHHDQPGELIKAESAYYLISESLPSPMGAFLTAFKSDQQLRAAIDSYGGRALDWSSLGEEITTY